MRDEMSIQDGLVFKDERVVDPHASRREMLSRIHSSLLEVNGCLTEQNTLMFILTWYDRWKLAKYVENMSVVKATKP